MRSFAGGRATTSIQRNQRISGKTTHVGSSPAGQVVLHLFVSRRMLDTETRYHEIEKLCLCLFFTCTDLSHVLLFTEIIIICKSDVIKHMLSAPVLKDRLGKWMFALLEFNIRYQLAKVVKGQALADLIAERINTNVAILSVRAWAMYFDGSACEDGCGIGILLVSPRGVTHSFSIRLPGPCTNNLAEYEAVRGGWGYFLKLEQNR
jgi:hypothetical protein